MMNLLNYMNIIKIAVIEYSSLIKYFRKEGDHIIV